MSLPILILPRLTLPSSALKPGGYVELIEFHVIPTSPDDTLPNPSLINQFYEVMNEAANKIGLDFDIASKFKGLLEDAGYEDVTEVAFDLPIGSWTKDRRLKEIGAFNRVQICEGLQGMAMGLLTKINKWTTNQVESFIGDVRREIQDRYVHSQWKWYDS